jgi:allophanate hydrolase subunit 2
MIVVQKPGLLASVQDLGRHGHRQLGICPGGALDVLALTLANRLVGNADGAAGLELTMGGCELRFEPTRASRSPATTSARGSTACRSGPAGACRWPRARCSSSRARMHRE